MRLIHKLISISVFPLFMTIILIITISYYQTREIILEMERKNIREEVNFNVQKIDTYFHGIISEVKSLSKYPVMQTRDTEKILTFLRNELPRLEHKYVEGLYYNNNQGQVFTLDGKVFDIRDRYYYHVIERGQPVISKVLFSKDTGKKIILILVPVFEKGMKAGAIGATVEVSSIFDNLKISLLETNGFAMLVDSDANYSANNRQNIISEQDLSLLAKKITEKKYGNFSEEINRKNYLIYLEPLKNVNGYFAITYNHTVILSKVKKIRTVSMIILLIAALVLLLVVFYLHRRLMIPIQELLIAHNTLKNGGESVKFHDHSSDELGELKRSFNNMVTNLKSASEARNISENKLRTSLKEKEILLKEIHHRVKNNLQIISSLLYLQSQHVSEKEAVAAFRESQNRIKSMAMLHEKLYQSRNLEKIDFYDYVSNLVRSLIYSYSVNQEKIKISVEIKNILIDIDTAIPCGLIINELLSNAIKYAFSDNETGVVNIKVEELPDKSLVLSVIDNGKGFPAGFNTEATESLGLELVNLLTEQLEGTLELTNDNGAAFRITFKPEK